MALGLMNVSAVGIAAFLVISTCYFVSELHAHGDLSHWKAECWAWWERHICAPMPPEFEAYERQLELEEEEWNGDVAQFPRTTR
jgi:hypothetical protein